MVASKNGSTDILFKLAMGVIVVILSGIVTWLFKLDERAYELNKEMVTHEEIIRLEKKIDDMRRVLILWMERERRELTEGD